MPCFVVFCKSGYDSQKEKVSLFAPPKDKDLFAKWERAIPRRDRKLTERSLICARHFKDEEINWFWTSGDGEHQVKIKLQKPKLIPGAIPSVFPGCPASCVPRIIKSRKPRNRPDVGQLSESSKAPASTAPPNEVGNRVSAPAEASLSDLELPSSLFSTWEEFDSLKTLFPNTSLVVLNDKKCLVEMSLSNHSQLQLLPIKELRTSKTTNEVQCFIMNSAFGPPQIMSTSDDTVKLATQFFRSTFCFGVNSRFSFVKTVKDGYKNILNRWQSSLCGKKIEMEGWSSCLHCSRLHRALVAQETRLSLQTMSRSSSCRKTSVSNQVSTSPEKKRLINRRLKTISKAKARLANANSKLKEENRSYREKIAKLDSVTVEGIIKRSKIGSAQAMVLREIIQVAKYRSKFSRRYSGDWLLTCLLMAIRGPEMYNFILNNGLLPLPSMRTIKRRISSIKVDCGFDSCFFEALKKKLETKEEIQKYGALVFDEVSVRKSLKTDIKSMQYQGIVDYGDIDETDGTNNETGSTDPDKLADHALVFGFQSFAEDYFQPIGCFAARGATNGVTLAKLMLQAIILLEQAGVNVVAVICDGAKPNRRMWKEFGVSGKLNSMKNFFQNPCDEQRKIFVLSDTPHLFKCVRNRLINHELMTKFGWVRWRHYQVLYHEDRQLPGKVRLCPRVTNSHVYPCSFSKMRVSLMTQIFSRSVSIALGTYRKRLTEELEDSEPTEKFTLYLNDLFDALNRRYPGEGIQPGSDDIERIKDGITFLDAWEAEVQNGDISKDNFLTPETAEGLRVTLHSTLDLIHYLHSVGYKYVLTAKINQDRLEQFFGIVRQAGRQNDHPSLPTFLQLYRLLSMYKLLKPPRFGNCSPDDLKSDAPPISMEDLQSIFSKNNVTESALQKLRCQLDSLVEQDDWEEELTVARSYCSAPELEDIALYVACGYLCRRLLKHTKCEVCRRAFLTKLDTSNLHLAELINAKSKGFLLYCNLYLFKLFRSAEQYFVQNAQFYDVYERTMADIFEKVDLTFPCDEHKSEVLASSLHYFLLMRMRQYEREQNREMKKVSRKKKKEAKLCTT